MRKLSSNSIDLVVTSPPYNCGIAYDIYQDNLSWEDYLSWCRTWLKEIKRVLKPDGRLALNVLMEMGIENNKIRVSPFAEFYNVLKEISFNTFGAVTWLESTRSTNSAWGSWKSPSSPYVYNPTEVVIFAYKDQWKKLNKGESTISKEEFIQATSGIWRLHAETRPSTIANFPVSLPKRCIELLTWKNDIVYDPFGGGGTTAIACLQTERRWVITEISKDYCKVAKKRIQKEKSLKC